MTDQALSLTDTVEVTALPVFAAGTYPQGTFDADFLHRLADGYDPAFHEAPNYLVHDDASAAPLAFGWIRKLYVKGRTLYADLAHVPRLFAELVLSGRIKKRSIELYENLAGKGPYLRALAWPLVPQVKALADVHPTQLFADRDDKFMSIFFQERKSSMNQTDPQFVTRDELEQMLAQLRTDLATEQKKLDAAAEVRTFCEQMVLAGKMAPAEQQTEQPLLVAQMHKELGETFAEGQVPLSRQRMDQYRRRAPIIRPDQPAAADTPPAGNESKAARCFHEHEAFFTRLGVKLEDLQTAEQAGQAGSNPLLV